MIAINRVNVASHQRNSTGFLEFAGSLAALPPTSPSSALGKIKEMYHRIGLGKHYQQRIVATDSSYITPNEGIPVEAVERVPVNASLLSSTD